MNDVNPRFPTERESSDPRPRWTWLCAGGCLLVVLIALLTPREHNSPAADNASPGAPQAGATTDSSTIERARRFARRANSVAAPAPTAEEIVAGKVSQFGRSRREIVHAIGRRSQKDVPDEVEKFFDALEAGRWEAIETAFKSMAKRSGQYEGSTHSPELDEFWPAVLEAYGAAEQAHLWPAQKLLDYGEAILGSLRPGMVYVGGTDPGRFIPTLLNETSGGEQHIVLTQNALADGRYQEYVRFLYGDHFGLPTEEESKRVFDNYIADAQKRLAHDQHFPGEPKQIRPGEDVRMLDGKVQVSGQVAVMAINEGLVKIIMEKNPDASFAIEQSFPFTSMYGNTTALGPVMELGIQDEQNALTAQRAAQSVDYWRATAQQVLADPQAAASRDVRLTYAKMAAEQAALFEHHNYSAEAEQAYRFAREIGPASPEAAFRLSQLLARTGRADEGRRLLEEFGRNNPSERSNVDALLRKDIFTGAPAP
jgi:hypothetical protein